MMYELFVLGCETIANQGGVYRLKIENDQVTIGDYYPCEQPMYAIHNGNYLDVVLLKPFSHCSDSAFFALKKDFTEARGCTSSLGACGCHIARLNNALYVANYLGGNVSKDGQLAKSKPGHSVNPLRQEASHPHCMLPTTDHNILCFDLGLDQVIVYNADLKELSYASVPSGAGVRHGVFSLDGTILYCINEIIPSVSIFTYQKGELFLQNTINIATTHKEANGAAIRLSSNGKFLYISLRKENVIMVFKVNKLDLMLVQSYNCGGDSPRDFNLFDDYLVVTNEVSNNVVVFQLVDGLIDHKVSEVSIVHPLCVL